MYSLFESPPAQRPNHAYSREVSNQFPKKKALVIGLNYFGTPQFESGAVLDAQSVADAYKLQLQVTDTLLILETPSLPIQKSQILEGIDTLLEGSENGDVLFLYYAGKSARDVAMIFGDGSVITCEELKSCLIEPLPLGVTLFAVFDSSFMGLGLRYTFEDASNGPAQSIAAGPRRICSSPDKWVHASKETESLLLAEAHTSVVILSHSSAANRGLLTWAFLKSIERNYSHSLSLAQLMTHIRATCNANGCFEPPKIESGQYIDLAVPFGRLVCAPI